MQWRGGDIIKLIACTVVEKERPEGRMYVLLPLSKGRLPAATAALRTSTCREETGAAMARRQRGMAMACDRSILLLRKEYTPTGV
jgi:hypothetical protein